MRFVPPRILGLVFAVGATDCRMPFVGCGERERTAPLADVAVPDAIMKDLAPFPRAPFPCVPIIALGLEHPGSLIILDDQLGRRIGQAAGLRITITLGVLLKAKRSGLIPSVAAILSKLRMAGMWIGDDLTAEVIGLAGE